MKLRHIKLSFLIVGLLLNVSCSQGQSDNDYNEGNNGMRGKDEVDEIVDCDRCDGSGQYKTICPYCDGYGELSGLSNITSRAACSMCGGEKTVLCTDCYGKGRVTCPNCNGRVSLGMCQHCGGAGKKVIILGDEFEFYNCPYCKGEGYIYCDFCENGYIKCRKCYGEGVYRCPQCHGSGLGEYKTDEYYHSTRCQECDGRGYFVSECEKCDGTGKIKRSELDNAAERHLLNFESELLTDIDY